jgi:hypothetical protein
MLPWRVEMPEVSQTLVALDFDQMAASLQESLDELKAQL